MPKIKQTPESKMVKLGFSKPGMWNFLVGFHSGSGPWGTILSEIQKIEYNDFYGPAVSQVLFSRMAEIDFIKFGRENQQPVLYIEHVGTGSQVPDLKDLVAFFRRLGSEPAEASVVKDALGQRQIRLWWD